MRAPFASLPYKDIKQYPWMQNNKVRFCISALTYKVKLTELFRYVEIWVFSVCGPPCEISSGRTLTYAAKEIAEPNVAALWSFPQARKGNSDRHRDRSL